MYFSGYLIRNSTKKDNNDSNSVIYYVAPTAWILHLSQKKCEVLELSLKIVKYKGSTKRLTMKEDSQVMLNVTQCNFMQQGIYKLQPAL